jgi:uncharacterized membrane protein
MAPASCIRLPANLQAPRDKKLYDTQTRKKGPESVVDKLLSVGRIFVSISLAVFGIQHFLYANFVATLVPAWMPARLFWAYFVGAAFLAAAAGILFKKTERPAATLLGAMFLLFVLMLHIPRIVAHPSDGNEWTSGFVALAMCGSAWVLAGASRLDEREAGDPFVRLGRYFFALALVAFGIQHYVYVRIATGLGPPWFPGRPLWAYLTGSALVVAGAAIFIGKKARLAATLLGTIILLLFLFLHTPRIKVNLHNPGPWTSGLEILAMCGGAFALASTLPREPK